MMRLILLGSVCLLGLVGCSDDAESTAPQTPQQSQAGPPPPPVAAPVPPAKEKETPTTETVEAKVGVGVKGRSLEKEGTVKAIAAPAIAYFRTKQRVVFEIQIPKALQLYEAMNGKKPATEQEFFEQIIKAQHINLPELPEGHKYIYDPETGTLLVQRPAQPHNGNSAQ